MNGNFRLNATAIIIGVIALIVVTVVIVIAGRPAPARHQAVPSSSPINRALNLECRSRLRNLENAIQIYMAENGHRPESLEQINELDNSIKFCPVTGRPYVYDPLTGNVVCPGH